MPHDTPTILLVLPSPTGSRGAVYTGLGNLLQAHTRAELQLGQCVGQARRLVNTTGGHTTAIRTHHGPKNRISPNCSTILLAIFGSAYSYE